MIKKFFLFAVVLTMLVIGSNPADYDPFHDNPDDTYNLIAANMPFPMPQEYPTDGHGHPLNGQGRPFVQPPPGPNADACKSVWDKNIPCPVDGKFYGNWGDLQPENCDNNYYLPDGRTLKPQAQKCECNIAMTKDMKDCPMNDDGSPAEQLIDGTTCMRYCQEKKHCHCIKICDAYVPDSINTTPVDSKKPVPKPAPKGKK